MMLPVLYSLRPPYIQTTSRSPSRRNNGIERGRGDATLVAFRHRRLRYVVVTESARGTGVGKMLLGRAEELARKRGCFRMSLVTAGWREDTHRFYERLGWDDYGNWFVKSLVADVAPSGQPIRDDT